MKPVLQLTAIEHQLQRTDPQAQREEPDEIERFVMHVAGLTDKNQNAQSAQHADRQVDKEDPAPAVILGQPPSAGPMIGPMIVPMPNTAIACPWRSGGLICRRVACDSGMRPAPAIPCNARKNTSSPRLAATPHSPEAMLKPMIQSRKMDLMPNR